MKILKLLIVAVLPLLCLTECKKGEDDPAVTVLSRKTRLTGDWRIESGTVNLTFDPKNKSPYSQRFTLTSSQLTMNESYDGSGTATIYTGIYTLGLTFKKDGSFLLIENVAGDVLKATGTWDFTSGVGEQKNKESIVLHLVDVSVGSSYYGLFNGLRTDITYRIKELRNKKMVLETVSSVHLSTDDSETSFGGNFTLVQ